MSIQKKTTKAGTVRWVARWRDPSGREHSKSFDTRRAAKEYESEVTRARKIGDFQPAEVEKITVRELFEKWLYHRPLRATSLTVYQNTLKNQLGPLADWPAQQVTTADVIEWSNQLQTSRPWLGKHDKGISFTGARNSMRHLRSAYNHGIAQGLLATNPVKIPPAPSHVEPDTIPTLEEIQAVIECVRRGGAQRISHKDGKKYVTRYGPSPEVADMMVTALLTGMRISELAGLIVREIDLDTGVIRVRKQLGKERPRRRVDLKTASSRRDIPIADELRPILQARVNARGGDDYVFTNSAGGPLYNGPVSVRVKRAAEHTGAIRVHFHALRHYFASSLITGGVPIQDVAAVLGHKSPALTLSVYTHVIAGSRDRVSAAISSTIGSGIIAGSRGLRVVGGGA
ncbi:hypothetical protein CPHO_07250 [Corynebacterium phocae]|uniref:Tyr recombinase domain-containing protein n=1 Tax=Corynebacterium phocae TaxID=161895 RepID=A0A1L7D3N8_9CORY|nr:site-specific integrase [Corynebacterium phocae]APT92720.1 hypothetical protein CPHO_07250 [Corynebacterium phocae]KAA8723027.1 site-specific integrase [Corynebacterium phocae]